MVTRGGWIAGPELLSVALVFPLSFLDALFIVSSSWEGFDGLWERSGGIPGEGVCESFDVLREARASGFGLPNGTWQDVTRGKVPRYGPASRRGLRLERLLGEAECHAVGLRAVHSDDEKHCAGMIMIWDYADLARCGFCAPRTLQS